MPTLLKEAKLIGKCYKPIWGESEQVPWLGRKCVFFGAILHIVVFSHPRISQWKTVSTRIDMNFLALFALLVVGFWLFTFHWIGNGIGRAVLGKDLFEELKRDPRGKKRISQRNHEMQGHYIEWEKASRDWHWKTRESLGLRESFLVRGPSSVTGAMKVSVDDRKLNVMDFLVYGRHRACRSLQTLIAIEAPDVEAPRFYLRKRDLGVGTDQLLHCYETIYGVQLLDYIIESDAQNDDVCDLFLADAKLFNDRFVDFIRACDWSGVEWTGAELLVYRFDRYMAPTEISFSAGQVIQLVELVRDLGASIPRYRDSQKAVVGSN